MKTLIVILAIGSVVSGCSSSDITNPNQIVFPTSSVSYHAQVAPYLALSCSQAYCHDGGANTAGGVDLTSWVGVRASNVTLPHDTTSPLVLVMKGAVQHSGAGHFTSTDNQRNGIKIWVLEGANNN